MKRLAKMLLLVMVAAMVLSAFAGCKKTGNTGTGSLDPSDSSKIDQSKPTLELTMFCYGAPNPVYDPQDDTLLKYVQLKAQEYVGRKVNFKFNTRLEQDMTYAQYLELQIASNTYPDVIYAGDLFWLAAELQYVSTSDRTRELSADLVKKNMPGFTARLQQYGIDPDKFLADNIHQDLGKLLWVPCTVPEAIMSNLADNYTPLKGVDADVAWKSGGDYYGWMMRDDVMKAIWGDSVKSEKDIMEIFRSKGGELDPEDIVSDFGWDGSMASIKDYMQKVKDLGMKTAGSGKLIQPGVPSSSSERATSLHWSMGTLAGYTWKFPLRFGPKPETGDSFFLEVSPAYHDYLQWWNDIYNAGLLDEELFVMKDDQMMQKITNGEYALFNAWNYGEGSQSVAANEGYGYRYWPVGYGICDFSANNPNNHYYPVSSFTSSTLFLTTHIKDEDLADAMKYLDYFLTKEHDDIAYWGMPEWTTGEGADRRYKEEYKEVEQWVLNGKVGEKDGRYYGLAYSVAVSPPDAGAAKQYLMNPITFFSESNTYPEGPYYVIPRDLDQIVREANTMNICRNTMIQKYIKPQTEFYMENNNFRVNSYNASDAAFLKYDDNRGSRPESDEIRLIVNMVIGKQADFEANYEAYIAYQKEVELFEAQTSLANTIAQHWEADVIANVIKK